ncbi:hypothetical protein [Pontibaca methylaminivorans]|uniref:Uncharacterized protein n=1 Tax=Pontibaca methylaminivorans TaxID=515897 RepID=A0A1R3WBZ7_9RHOB|nr:hypothetical protein [Pontibaca methylaminivorans]SIT74853.1 hypothetical protein SAMN05421849_0223 [Pontibaca methylaminivorans]
MTKITAIDYGVRLSTDYETRIFFRVGSQVHEWIGDHDETAEFPEAPDNWPGNGARPTTKRVCRALRHTGTPVSAATDAELLAAIRQERKAAVRYE